MPPDATTTIRAHGRFHGLNQGICGRRFINGVAKRQVDDVDAKLALVRRHEFDGADHVTGVARAVVIQNLERNEPRLRRNSR